MRAGIKDADFIYDNCTNKFIGICLGWDYVAEHEWGIKDLALKLGLKTDKYGFDSTRIYNYSKIRVSFVKGIKGTDDQITIISTREVTLEQIMRENKVTSEKNTGIEFYTTWDGGDFAVAFTRIPDESRYVVNDLIKAFNKKDICLSNSSSNNPFAGSGLAVLIYSRIPKDVKESVKKDHINSRTMRDRFNKHPTILRLKAKQKEWREQHPSCFMHTPWGYMALSPKGVDGDDFKIWLNPENQRHINCGWVNLKDIEDWIEGRPGNIIKSAEHWEELKYLCSGSLLWKVGMHMQHFSGVPAKYYNLYNHDTKMPIIPQLSKNGVMTKTIKDRIAGIVKDVYRCDITDQLEYGYFERDGKRVHPKHAIDIKDARPETEDKVHGFFYALALMGYGTFEAINSPASEDNFSFWSDVLFAESLWEVICERGEGFEPWIKNKKPLSR